MSPGTTSLDDIVSFSPSLTTLALGTDSCFRLFIEDSAFLVCTVPKTAFRIRTRNIISDSIIEPVTICIRAATISIITIGSLKLSRNIFQVGSLAFSFNSFFPYSSSLELASAWDKPS